MMNKSKSLKTTLIGAVLVLIAVAAVVGFRYAKQNQKGEASAQLASAGKAKGPDSAPVRIVGFSDFQCPACAHAGPIVDALMAKYPGKIQYVYKHFPLRMHVWAPVAHQAAECASVQGLFWDYYKKLYDNQAAWSALPDPMVTLVEYAKQVGANMESFSACMVSSEVAAGIMAEKKEGEDLQVRSTPTFFINGKMFAGQVELQMAGEVWIRSLLGLPAETSKSDALPLTDKVVQQA
ncbi:MAG TPA: thioredoxin domain-containing protein [Candidatus Omnitrophota bacterium]|nr:thioredoxin domain-containing protein [Candidatus Omnitrophota bacterium]